MDIKKTFDRADYQAIANRNPKLAWALIQGQARQLQSFHGQCIIEDGTPGNPIPVTFEQIVDQIYVVDANFVVQTPRAYAGSIWRAQQVNGNSMGPDIEARLQVSQGLGASNYIIADQYTPIEQLFRSTMLPTGGCCSWTNGWTILSWQAIQMTLQLSRTYLPIELPVRVRFSLLSAYLGAPYQQISIVDAVSGLGELGYDLTQPNLVLAAEKRRNGFGG